MNASITIDTPLADVAAIVAGSLERAGLRAVLTGGACATIHSDGAYLSHDLDFIIVGAASRRVVDAAMASAGFRREGDRYVHEATPFFVEFPRGPLAIGEDIDIEPTTVSVGSARVTALSPTDSCRDRLAAFYHWTDRQSLDVAIEIALRHPLEMAAIERWSRREGFADSFREFQALLDRRRHGWA